MSIDNQYLDKIVCDTLLHSCNSKKLGICNGKMGIVLFFFHYFKYTNNQMYEDIAGELLDDIFDDLDLSLNISFNDGLSGIGWGIEYLAQNNFIQVSADVLDDIDCKIAEMSLTRMVDLSFETGVEGIAWYVLLHSHLQNKQKIFDEIYYNDLYNVCANNLSKVSTALSTYLQNKQLMFYPFDYVLNKVISTPPDFVSWKNGLKLLSL